MQFEYVHFSAWCWCLIGGHLNHKEYMAIWDVCFLVVVHFCLFVVYTGGGRCNDHLSRVKLTDFEKNHFVHHRDVVGHLN